MNSDELKRYNRQIQLDQIGLAGQSLLKRAKVLCIGAGGLGSPLLLYLAAAGVGHLGIVDDDTVALENLHRQILFSSQEVGRKKIQVAKERLLKVNPHLIIETYDQKLNYKNAQSLISQYDIVADCSDNFATRYLINDSCFAENKPFVYASLLKFQGQCSFFSTQKKLCFRCLFPHPPTGDFLDCNQAGVIGVLPGFLGILQATLILKWILKIDENPVGRLFTVDLNTLEFKSIAFSQDPQCRLCVQQHYDFLNEPEIESIDFQQLKTIMASPNKFLLLDVRTPEEFVQYNLGGQLIPLSELPERCHELYKEALILIYCQTGQRSLEAAKILKAHQFSHVKYLAGGLCQLRTL
jgi:sulfur-carrier protein adenylyltransferase/sulfurtransferase